ncbi:MAG: MmcQ/YjbR family DNA-binding protein [Bacteroidetes bacterium]|nr:MmcQ/YjbR family DNA-binding protein [Bacteroidota bacterium]
MVSTDTFRQLAMSLPGVSEEPHFENTSFRVQKKIFATLNVKANRGCVKLSEIDQSVFSAYDNTIIYAVPNAWGKQGWTNIELKTVRKSVCHEALKTAYTLVSAKKSKK